MGACDDLRTQFGPGEESRVLAIAKTQAQLARAVLIVDIGSKLEE